MKRFGDWFTNHGKLLLKIVLTAIVATAGFAVLLWLFESSLLTFRNVLIFGLISTAAYFIGYIAGERNARKSPELPGSNAGDNGE